jgi:hypothetical protein
MSRGSNLQRKCLAQGLSALALVIVLPGARVTAQSLDDGRSYALLIGVENYQLAPPLRYIRQDVSQISRTLRDRGGFGRDRILELTDAASAPEYQPSAATLRAQIPNFLRRPLPTDTLIVYFSGHGFRDQEGKMYLAPLDCDPAKPEETGLPVEWLRDQLKNCKAKTKLLIIDSCHAGSDKGDEDTAGVPAELLGKPFGELSGVFTLASSSAREKSQLWDAKQHSLFTYWLNQGLKGHADENSDGRIHFDELYGYVHDHVRETAERSLGRTQTPARIIRGETGVPVVLRLQPLSLKKALDDLAHELADSLVAQQQGAIGVLEFTNATQAGEMLGSDFGLLGQYCAEVLEQRLIELGAGKFSVVDRARIREALSKKALRVDDLASTQRLKDFGQSVGGMPLLVSGRIIGRDGRVVTLNCKLVRTDQPDQLAAASAIAQINESEWAMLGRSAAVSGNASPQAPPSIDGPRLDRRDQLVNTLDQRAQSKHPFAQANFPFPIHVMIKSKSATGADVFTERAGKVEGNDCVVSLARDEVYELWVENNSGQKVVMRLLVDGLNTLPEPLRDEKGSPLKDKGVVVTQIAPRVNLAEARGWVLGPTPATIYRARSGAKGVRGHRIQGFVAQTGSRGEGREFRVVDGGQSIAARRQFTDQLGMITAAFYSVAPRGARGSIGTGLGDEYVADYTEEDTHPRDLIAAVTLRYVANQKTRTAARRDIGARTMAFLAELGRQPATPSAVRKSVAAQFCSEPILEPVFGGDSSGAVLMVVHCRRAAALSVAVFALLSTDKVLSDNASPELKARASAYKLNSLIRQFANIGVPGSRAALEKFAGELRYSDNKELAEQGQYVLDRLAEKK